MSEEKKVVWGIDVGTSSLKAVRVEEHEGSANLTAYDFIEYTKPVSFPDADGELLKLEAITEFLGRNAIKKEQVVLGIHSHDCISRTCKFPVLQQERLETIAAYEAQQQIPFDLADVYWDWQKVNSDEILIQAAKKERIHDLMEPWHDQHIHVMGIQSTNHALVDAMLNLHNQEDISVPSQIYLHMGSTTTECVIVYHGHIFFRVLAVGGDHFTRAITKDLNLTMVKAEHLKRNFDQADDTNVVLDAMERVWKDLYVEIKRTIDFDRRREVEPIEIGYLSGGGFLIPLSDERLSEEFDLHFKVIDVYDKPQLTVAYGLAIAGLGLSWSQTNLLKGKKNVRPWNLDRLLSKLPRIRIEWPK